MKTEEKEMVGRSIFFKEERTVGHVRILALERLHVHGEDDRLALPAVGAECLRRLVKKYSDRAGIQKRVTPRVLRHTLATNLILNGENISIDQKKLGHGTSRAR